MEMISHYVPIELIDNVREMVISHLDLSDYEGPFGIDMMICDGSLLHPCVEINLRRTMGHVALALTPKDDDLRRVMRIDYTNGNYKLTIHRL
jgi:hypothetical protein